MTPQYILRAAIRDMERGTRQAHCSNHNAIRYAQSELDNLNYASHYGEPRYSDPPKGILFANWNHFPRGVDNLLEKAGFAVEWNDEWIISYETNKAYRTSPDCYAWTPYYVMTDDGEVYGGDEIEDGSQTNWYVNEYLLNEPRRANLFKIDLAKYGFQRFNGEYESGWHPGQTNDPSKVFELIRSQHPDCDVVFSIEDTGQFDTRWSAWFRLAE